jgi:integrative and conjugative element protein (TIGR02256 family)
MTPRLLIHHAVAARFESAAAACVGHVEEGGILLGAYREGGMEVTGLTEAAPSDERMLTSFVRQDTRHQEVATEAWTASGGTITMVGEWHTHPSGEPRPSATDLGTWKAALRRTRLPMAFVVVAPGMWWAYWGPRGFMFTRLPSAPRP